MNTLLKVSELGVNGARRGEWQVEDIYLEVHAGEKVAVIGETGVGKTVMAEMIVGLRKPHHGSIESFGDIAWVPQNFNLYRDLTVQENLEFVSTINGFDRSQIAELIQKTGFNGWEGCKVKKLSIGQQKMLLLAAALCQNYSILVMDEPTAGLSTAQRKTMMGIFDDITAVGQGILIFTDVDEDAALCDKVLKLQKDCRDEASAYHGVWYACLNEVGK
ncbi:MAG TPA: ATP-binding cassette domain-containing protein [Bacillota bacterium]|nr:ATP-binding cassette domain-containing protein [Bacillota bacterium]